MFVIIDSIVLAEMVWKTVRATVWGMMCTILLILNYQVLEILHTIIDMIVLAEMGGKTKL